MLDANFPTNLMDFQDRFGSERKCVAYLFSKRYPEGFRCPRCACRKGYKISKRVLIECASCEYQASLTAGTKFHGTRTPLTVWLRANFEFVSQKNGCNAMDLQRLFGLCRKYAWAWLHRIRDVMVHSDQKLLVGVVEIDETHVGGSEEGVHGRSRGSRNHLVLGAVEVVTHEDRGAACGRTRLEMVPSGSAEHLQTWVASNVKEGAKAHTDGCRGYDGLESVYDPLTVK